MKQLTRKLRDDAARETEKQHIQLMGLKRRDIPKWVNRNLIDVLNQKASPAAQRITKIVEMFREAARLSEELRLLDKDDAVMSQLRKLNVLIPELNASIYRYIVHPHVSVHNSRFGAPLIACYMCSARTDGEARERRAVQFLVEHVELIGRIRRCRECKAWFFAVTDHQKFCGDKCRVRCASHSEDFKADRARYMRETYRPQEKERELKAKLEAGRKK